MIKKLTIVTLASLLLGGCTLTEVFKPSEAVKDSQPEVVATATPTPMASPDPNLDAIPKTSTSSDEKSLETDINNTVILDEDFSDLK